MASIGMAGACERAGAAPATTEGRSVTMPMSPCCASRIAAPEKPRAGAGSTPRVLPSAALGRGPPPPQTRGGFPAAALRLRIGHADDGDACLGSGAFGGERDRFELGR